MLFYLNAIIFAAVESYLRILLYKFCFPKVIERKRQLLCFIVLLVFYTVIIIFHLPLLYTRMTGLCFDIAIAIIITRNFSRNQFAIGFIPTILTIISEILSLFVFRLLASGQSIDDFVENNSENWLVAFIFTLIEIILYVTLILFIKKASKNRYFSNTLYTLGSLQFLLITLTVDKVTDVLFSVENNRIYPLMKQDLFLIIIFLLGMIVVFCIIINLQSILAHKERFAAEITQRKNLEEENFKQLHNAIKLYQSLKHDLRDFIAVINRGLQTGKYDEITAFSNLFNQNFQSYDNLFFTENVFLNDLLSEKKKAMDNHGITFTSKISYLGPFSVDDIQLCSLIANALNNAIEACDRVLNPHAKEINLEISMQQNLVCISLVNSTNGQYIFANNKRLMTTKNEKGHGIGLRRMQQIVDYAGGNMEYENMSDRFKLRILLPDRKVVKNES